ncbi:UDP-glucosyl transferase 85A2 [Hibiscus trionum]|uniref:Glycosyltransferase n=1 Tax=Hibiscus trionum TaxID=183268 RepID=A0A9W7H360_HIBTR|nr:UDP-glucosyl transferase 85A2 [Hibiscus trionum]
MDKEQQPQTSPHVLIFPLPAQGHVNSMLKLAELLALAGLKITFLNSDFVHEQLLRHTDVLSRFSKYAGFDFRTIPDGLPDEHPRAGHGFMKIFEFLESTTKPIFKEMMVNIKPRVDCIIADGVLGIAVDVAEELGIPVIQFRTISACCIWAYFAVSDMIQAGELPIKGKEDMDRLITSVPGMETFLRCRDLPSFCRASDTMDSTLQRISQDTRKNFEGHGLLLNTFEDLEGDILSHMRTKAPKIYTVGPLHLHLRTRLSDSSRTLLDQSSNSFHEVDRSCLPWLDKQPKGSVIYVSFGSLAVLSSEEVIEFWFGLVNSGKRFLWVLRPDNMVEKGDSIPVELIEGTKQRGCIVSWAPQEEVLGHGAIGGFLSHSGWNSTLESVVEGVPMICWPYFADQQINSRFVSQVWGLGLDMKDLCDRQIVEKMVNGLMVEKRQEFVKSATKVAKLAKECVNVGGSSYCNLDRLVEDIRSMKLNINLSK